MTRNSSLQVAIKFTSLVILLFSLSKSYGSDLPSQNSTQSVPKHLIPQDEINAKLRKKRAKKYTLSRKKALKSKRKLKKKQSRRSKQSKKASNLSNKKNQIAVSKVKTKPPKKPWSLLTIFGQSLPANIESNQSSWNYTKAMVKVAQDHKVGFDVAFAREWIKPNEDNTPVDPEDEQIQVSDLNLYYIKSKVIDLNSDIFSTALKTALKVPTSKASQNATLNTKFSFIPVLKIALGSNVNISTGLGLGLYSYEYNTSDTDGLIYNRDYEVISDTILGVQLSDKISWDSRGLFITYHSQAGERKTHYKLSTGFSLMINNHFGLAAEAVNSDAIFMSDQLYQKDRTSYEVGAILSF